MTFHLPPTFYDPPEGPDPLDCPTCDGAGILYGEEPPGWWHGSGVNIPEYRCTACNGEGTIAVDL